ncbi:putative Mitochondrial N(5)-glutamine methyltransferase MTQ1 [Leptomonas seymouri]|uniref:Putative Mitochondrial N(5)-glutamine methyltransferase MTQ1 n=1 Tax=Leptomonas seymouri TaxID=5684 RepID=A0A0N1HXT0_LEPSE|nr:putative Mitochondrial N(5)-glutamine methyltransferase MTQ1 [Leptomonas seymouri]|eukprot:KPI87381.1 putative Mitochondrial N(5)-glutamine methyltransferase MTQ1 [Leptomonas seymouri]
MISATRERAHVRSSTSAAAIFATARHKSDIGYAKTHHVQYVPTRADALEEEECASGEADSKFSAAAEAMLDGNGEAEMEPSLVDFTKDVPAEKLERLYRGAGKATQFLSLPERQMFTKMIYETFYKDEGTKPMDPAMLYQASLEIQWVEQWMTNVAKEKQLSIDDARREVKKALLERVDLHKPLSYICGSQPFFGCNIHCEAPLLCPRPETEMWTHWLVYNHLNRVRGSSEQKIEETSAQQLNILDVCCGTGCIGVALAKHVPNAVVTALDILPQAVAASQLNAQRNGIPESRYKAIESDMFDYFTEQNASSLSAVAQINRQVENSPHNLQAAPERLLGTIRPEFVGIFDVIVSNPPYVLPEQYIDLPRTITHWESKTALVGDDYRESRQYLYFKELCVHGAKLLKPRHMRPAVLRETPNMVIEVGLQAHMVADLMEKSGLWKDVCIHLDYGQQERWVSAVASH